MSDQNPLDDFLKRKLSERTYSFQESYWEAAEGLIEADRKKKKRRGFLWWWIAGLGLLAISMGVASLWNTGSVPNNQSIAEQIQAPLSHTPIIDSSQIVQGHNKPSVPVDLHGQANNQIRPDTPLSGTSVLPTLELADSKQIAALRQVSPPSQIVMSSEEMQGEITAGTIQPQESSNGKGLIQNELARQMAEDSSMSHAILLTGMDQTDSIATNASVFKLENIDRIPANSFLLSSALTQDIEPVSLYKYIRKNHIGIRFGQTAAEGFQNMGSTKAPRNYQGFAGIHYARRLNDRLRLHTGLEYSTRGGLNSDSTYQSTAFSFGFTRQSTTISPQKLHTLELPLSLALRIKNRHYIQLGASASYLLNVSSLVLKGTETDFGSNNPTSERVWGYSQGFSKVDASLLTGYQYYLGRGLYLGIQSRYGLRDVTDPIFFRNDRSDRNIRWQLSLTYDFLNF